MKKLLTSMFAWSFIAGPLFANDTWVQKANFGGVARRGCFAFSIAGKGYIGAGEDSNGNKSDFWEYDPGTNTWTQKSSLNTARRAPMSFVLNGIGYCCMGFGTTQINDLWAYDPSLNTWTQKANFGGAARYGAAGFAIGNKGYIGLGAPAGGNGPYSSDFWEYDPSTNSWAQKASPTSMTPRYQLIGFSIGTKGYMGMGYDGSTTTLHYDLFCYDQGTNSWTQKSSLPSTTAGGSYPFTFAFAGKGYVGTGNTGSAQSGFWEYNPVTDAWVQRANYGGGPICVGIGFSIGAIGYAGTGFDLNNNNNTFYEYTPINVGVDENGEGTDFCSVYPNPVSDHATLEINIPEALSGTTLSVFDASGKLVKETSVDTKRFSFERGDLSSGIYFYQVINDGIKVGHGKLVLE